MEQPRVTQAAHQPRRPAVPAAGYGRHPVGPGRHAGRFLPARPRGVRAHPVGPRRPLHPYPRAAAARGVRHERQRLLGLPVQVAGRGCARAGPGGRARRLAGPAPGAGLSDQRGHPRDPEPPPARRGCGRPWSPTTRRTRWSDDPRQQRPARPLRRGGRQRRLRPRQEAGARQLPVTPPPRSASSRPSAPPSRTSCSASAPPAPPAPTSSPSPRGAEPFETLKSSGLADACYTRLMRCRVEPSAGGAATVSTPSA